MTAIFKRELTAFFKSPSGWFIMAVYAFLSSLMFSLFVIWSNTSYLGNYLGLWVTLVDVITVSVLAVRFFSEEHKNKTDQLIMTSPVGLTAVVMGKFFGAYTVMLACSAVNIVYFAVLDFFDDTAHEFGTLLTPSLAVTVLGSLLFLAAIVSVAVFVSALTESPIAAAAGTFGVFLLMYTADFLSSMLPSLLASAVSALNIFAMFGDFANGILSVRPIVYYLSVTAVFLFLTVRILERRRWN